MPDLVLRAATLIDGTGAEPIRPGEVTIRDGKITAVGSPPRRDPADAEIVDYGDATLLPGLIDAHVHLQFTAGPDHPTTRGIHMGASDSERIATAIGNAQRGLATGVTTMRDTGGYFTLNMDVRDAINAGHVIGPRLLVCGAPITTTAGHLHWCGLRADNRDEVVEAVRTMAEAGADFIKVMATGGMMTPGTSPGMTQYSESELQALVDDSHRLRKQVAAHVLGTTGCILAIDAGVDTLEHCSWLDESGEHGAFRFDAEAAARIQPGTQSVHMTVGAGSREHVRGVDHLDEMSEADREELYERGRYHRAMRASGTPVVVSSDAGVMTTKHDEFALTVIAAAVVLDLSPVEAINITTYAPASTIGLGDVTGALKPGLAADVLVVEDDVGENICCVADPIAVYLNGREVARHRRLIAA
ncbi:MAG: amidohydrolase family protein [Chloroflexota bacterium]|nr:amidohydrolase family protein [Chloroflexota bacterium]